MSAEGEQGRGARGRRVVDGAVFGLYEDDEPERRAPVGVLAVLLVVALVVAVLVVRAVNTDASLEVPEEAATTTTTAAPAPVTPSVDALRLLVPPELDACEEPPEPPADGPVRVVLRCAGPDVIESVELTLYGTVAERDDAFDFVAALLEVPDREGECAVGRAGRHDYVGVEQVGQVACRSVDGRTGLLWTSDAAPILALATGEGSYAAQYAWWAELVDRTDASFPTGEERAVLGRVPDALLDACDRDPDLGLAAGGDLAITCRPERSPAAEVSWITFASDEDLTRWFRSRRERLADLEVDDGPDACSAGGFGQPSAGIDDDPAAGPPATPDAGDTTYELGSSTGSVLCHRDAGGRGVVVWARDAGLLGSVAVGVDGGAMRELLAWWERGGHLP